MHPGIGAAPADVSTQADPPVTNETAAAAGLNVTATPHNPATATTTVVLYRSKIVMDVDPSLAFQTFQCSVDEALLRATPRPW
jgi:hypothetical protein